MRLISRLALATATTGATVLAWPRLVQWQQRTFAEQVAQRALRSAGADATTVRRMWTLGLSATATLAQLATVQRTDVAHAAQEALADQLAAWEIDFEHGPDREVLGERLAVMSEALAANAGRLDAEGQFWARRMARQMVVASELLAAEDAWAVLAACERTLSAPVVAQASSLEPVARATVSEQRPLTVVAAPSAAPPTSPQAMQKSAADAPIPSVTTTAEPSPPADLSVIMPSTEPLASAPVARVRPLSTDNPLRAIDGTTLSTPGDGKPGMAAAPNVVAPQATGVDVPSPLEMRHARQRLRETSDQELIRLADTASKFEAAAAREALRSRGYSDAMLRLTRELRELPAVERRQALERAGGLPASDAQRLLRWFVADEDAEVRLQALTLLATSGDPKLAEIARERAVEDADPRVAELAAKLMELR